MPDYKFTESSFENAFLQLFHEKYKDIYQYVCGYDIHRQAEDVLLKDDFKDYLFRRYPDLNLNDYEIDKILNNLETARGTSVYESMNKTLEVLRNGYTLDRSDLGLPSVFIEYFDYDDVTNNAFKIINQYEVKGYTLRRPDVVIFINGIPVSVVELKNMSDESITIYDAYQQVHVRYVRDIPNLMRYSLITIISDGINTKFGSLFAGYIHFFPWKSIDGLNYCKDGIESLYTLVEGLFNPKTLLNIIKIYIYFPDTDNKKSKDLIDNELMILPKYSQYYASEVLFENIKKHMKPNGDGKGGTYFGATGCGKSYTMLFLSRRLTTSLELDNPTILLLTDRTDLDDQLAQIFEVSTKYLVDANTRKIKDREDLTNTLRGISSGGIFLMTVQKFDEDIKLLSDRNNIICISDEAHRTQVNLDAKYEQSSTGIKKHYGFAKYLRESFPNATYVGFTGTPVDQTINVFGPVAISYKMKQAVEDGSTVTIDILEGPSSVRLDETKLKIVDKYYEEQLKTGNNEYQIEQSKKDMATVRTIIDNDSRLDVIVNHMIAHYEKRLEEGSTVNGKAMFVCYDRKIAYKIYKKIIALRPQWNKNKRTQIDESTLSEEELQTLKPIEMIKLVATRNSNDEPDLYNLLGDDEYRKGLATLFKDEFSNFKIAIVVDMWITGFDCESLDTMYVDKPLEKHTLIQTISRVNRVFEGKESGLIVDYIGLEASLAKAMALYSCDINPTKEEEASYVIFKDQLQILDEIMINFDMSKFITGTDLDRLQTLEKGIEYVQKTKETETRFMGVCLRMKKAFDLCVGDERITDKELAKVHFYTAIRSAIFKATGEGRSDATRMNQEVKKLVDACIQAYGDVDDEKIIPTDIFSSEYLKKIEGIPYKNTKFKMLLELLKKAIKAYNKTNQVKAIEFSKRMKILVDKYNNRDATILVSNDEVINEFIDVLSEEARKILEDIQKDANEFKNLGISFEEKAFYDILKAIRDKYKFEYDDKRLIALSKKVKEVVDDKSKYIDWSSRTDIKAAFQSDIIRLLNKNGYPPQTFDDVYNKVLAQVENFKKYQN